MRSLVPSVDLINDYVKRHKIDVLCLSETWLRRGEPDVPLANLALACRHEQRGRRGGGVAIYCRNDLAFSKVSCHSTSMSSRLECIWVNVKCGHNRAMFIGCTYRPPTYEGIKSDLEALEVSVKRFLSQGRQVVLCGDMNCDLLRPNLYHVRLLQEFINNVGMHQCVSHPTRITNVSATLIDIVLASDSSFVTKCSSENCIVSDHNLIIVQVKATRSRSPPTLITYRNWNNVDFNLFSRDLTAVSWSPVFSTSDPEQAWQGWTDAVLPVLDHHAPVVTTKIKHKCGFGLSAAIRNSIRDTTNQLRIARCSGAPADVALYKTMRRQVRGAISLERRLKFELSVKTHRSSRDTWSLINMALGKSKTVQPMDKTTARMFNEFFCSVGANAQSGVIATRGSSGAVSGPPRVLSVKFGLRPATYSELKFVIRSLNVRTSCGPEKIPVSFFQSFLGRLSSSLLHVINASIVSGIVPPAWKIAEVVPIYKGKDDPKNASNYRPISLLSVGSKILERLVSFQLKQFLDDCHVLPDEQFGFRANHSVDHALIALTESIRSSVDNGEVCILVSLDLSKAFDSVSHTMLLQKLSQYGIDHPWFTSYLSGRSQYVRGCDDAIGHISSGVPQGSVLGPTLFNIFVNDLPSVVHGLCKIVQYADDTQVLVCGSPHDLSAIVARLHVVLQRLGEWFARNQLALNVLKSQVVVFGSKVTMKNVNLKSLNIIDITVPVKPSLTSLGVTLDSCLTWSCHIDGVIRKCMGMLIRLSHLRRVMPLKTVVLLINSLVLPHIRFCICLWGNCSVTQGKRINKIIKFAQRIAGREIDRLAWRGDLALQYKIATLKIIRQCLLFPECVSPLMSTLFKSRQSERTTRQSGNLDLVKPKTEFKKLSLSYNGIKLWNNLPNRVRNSSKTEFVQYLIENHTAN